MAQYHPDKVAHLGPDLQTVAAEKAKSLNLAYHTICTEQRW
jgi:DnaJ-domain-containing protein 1